MNDHPGTVSKPTTAKRTTGKASTTATVPTTKPSTITDSTDQKESLTVTTTPKTRTASEANSILDSRTPDERVISARQMVRQRTEEHGVTTAAVSALDARLDDGDESVTGAMLGDAANDAKVSAARLVSARKALATAMTDADRAAAKESPDVAEAVAAFITANAMTLGLYGVDVVVTDRLMPTDMANVAVPSIRIKQPKPTAHSGAGTFSGDLLIAYVTDESSGMQSWKVSEKLSELARDGDEIHGITRFSPGYATKDLGQGVSMTIGGLIVQHVKPTVPVISSTPSASALSSFGQGVASAVAWNAGVKTVAGVEYGRSGDASALRSNVTCHARDVRLTGTDTDGRITRRTVVVDLIARAEGAILNYGGDLLAAMAANAEAYAGKFIAGVGRIESAKALGAMPIDGGGRGLSVSYVFVSRTV